MATISAKKSEVERTWYLVDAENKVLGRLATQVATILRGKHKPLFTPHVDTGDFYISGPQIIIDTPTQKVDLPGGGGGSGGRSGGSRIGGGGRRSG